MADEFMEVVLGHWDSWDDDAIVVDKASRPVRASRQGPPARPQGQIVPLARDRSRCRARARAARWSSRPGSRAAGRHSRRAGANSCSASTTRSRSARRATTTSRHWSPSPAAIPTSVRVAPAVYCRRRRDQVHGRGQDGRHRQACAKPVDGLALLSEALNFDFYSKPMDEPFTDEELKPSAASAPSSTAS